MMTKGNNSIFVDSSAWISFAIPSDSNFTKALVLFKSFSSKTKLMTSLFNIDEVITIVRKKLDQIEASKLHQQFIKLETDKKLKILPISREEIKRAMDQLIQYPTPNTFSLTDATNIVLAKKHKIPTLFTFDTDFRKLKIPGLKIIP